MSEKVTTRIQTTADVRLPKPPNFFRYGTEPGQVIDVADIRDVDLTRIAEGWRDALIANAKRRREMDTARRLPLPEDQDVIEGVPSP